MRKLELIFLMVVLSLSIMGFTTESRSETIELTLAHFVPPQHVQHKNVMEPWARKIEKLTNSQVKINIVPLGKLGPPPGQYDLAVSGKADITFGLPGYTPGKFPLTSVMDLPFMVNSAEEGALVLWNIYERFLKDEFKDVKVLWLFCHPPGQIHIKNKEVKRMEDLKGLRITTSGMLQSEYIKLLGGIPIQAPINKIGKLLQSGEADGSAMPYGVLVPFKLFDTLTYHTEVNLYVAPFYVVMNKNRYGSLPDNIRKVIDENSGEAMSILAGREYDKDEKEGLNFLRSKGGSYYRISEDEQERWKQAAMPVGDEWVEKMTKMGLPGKEVLEMVIELLLQIQS